MYHVLDTKHYTRWLRDFIQVRNSHDLPRNFLFFFLPFHFSRENKNFITVFLLLLSWLPILAWGGGYSFLSQIFGYHY